MTILLHKPGIIKVTTKGMGESKIHKILTTLFMDDPQKHSSQPSLRTYICQYCSQDKVGIVSLRKINKTTRP